MSEKKQLNEEELEMISGGASYSKNENELEWKYSLNKNVTMHNTNGDYFYGTVTKKGKLYASGFYFALYYIEFPSTPEVDGWYAEEAIDCCKTVYATGKWYYPSIVVTEE